jgi:hypothetical protein
LKEEKGAEGSMHDEQVGIQACCCGPVSAPFWDADCHVNLMTHNIKEINYDEMIDMVIASCLPILDGAFECVIHIVMPFIKTQNLKVTLKNYDEINK